MCGAYTIYFWRQQRPHWNSLSLNDFYTICTYIFIYLHYNWKLVGLLDQTNSPPTNSPHNSPLIRPTNFQASHRSLSRSITVYLSTYLTPAPPSTPVVPPNHSGWRRRCGGRASGCWRGRRWSPAACWATAHTWWASRWSWRHTTWTCTAGRCGTTSCTCTLLPQTPIIRVSRCLVACHKL